MGVLYCIVLYYIVLYCIVLYCIVMYCIVLYCIVLEGLEEDEEITADTYTNTYTHTHNSDSQSQPVPSGYGLRENIAILLVEVTECLRENSTNVSEWMFPRVYQNYYLAETIVAQ